MMLDIWKLEKEAKICAIDIDGVLVDYPKCWIDFCNKELKTNFADLGELKKGLSYYEYKKMKILYRESGVKASLPMKENANLLIKNLQLKGYKVILLTARPYRRHRRIWKDTIIWLKNNNIEPDGIIWDEEKHWAVLREFPYLKFMIEDNAELANQIANLNKKVFLINNEYNQQELHQNCKRIFDLMDLLKEVE